MDELFFASDLSMGDVTLSAAESKHCLRVKRHGLGDSLTLFDGQGSWAEARLTDVRDGKCVLQVVERHLANHPPPQTVIATAPTKNASRIEWFLEKATELGVARVVMMQCSRSERVSVRMERLERIILQAAKQSHNYWLPELVDVTPFAEVVETSVSERFIASQSAVQSLQGQYKYSGDVIVLIGPEGDFTSEEISMAEQKGFSPANLGSNRLRTETAALVACHTITLMHG